VSQFNSNSVVVNTGYAPTYYPATSDPRRATAVEVKSGTELTSIDIRMDGQQGSSRLRGRIVDSKTGQPARNVTIMLVPRDLDADDDPKTGTYNPTDGTFEFTNVAPGPYFMVAMGGSFMGFLATLMGEGAGTPGAAFPNFATPDTGQLSLDVRGDMDDIVLKTSSAFTISGIVTASGLGSISALPGFGQIRVRLGGDTDSMMGGMFARPSAIAADGTFTITVTPGTYRIEVTGLPSTVFVKSARLGASDILDGTAVIDESTGGVLQVEIATNPGEIDGRIVDRDQKPLASMQAVLIPEKRSRHDLYKTATSDGDGRFSITGITPGNYTLFVWEDLEPNAHYDPEVLSQYESLGRKLVIGESRKVDVELTPIRMIP
jgi:hypothetical protein